MSTPLDDPKNLSRFLAAMDHEDDRIVYLHDLLVDLGDSIQYPLISLLNKDVEPFASSPETVESLGSRLQSVYEQSRLIAGALAVYTGLWDGKEKTNDGAPLKRNMPVKPSPLDEFTEFVKNMPRVTRDQIAAYDAALSSDDETQSD